MRFLSSQMTRTAACPGRADGAELPRSGGWVPSGKASLATAKRPEGRDRSTRCPGQPPSIRTQTDQGQPVQAWRPGDHGKPDRLRTCARDSGSLTLLERGARGVPDQPPVAGRLSSVLARDDVPVPPGAGWTNRAPRVLRRRHPEHAPRAALFLGSPWDRSSAGSRPARLRTLIRSRMDEPLIGSPPARPGPPIQDRARPRLPCAGVCEMHGTASTSLPAWKRN